MSVSISGGGGGGIKKIQRGAFQANDTTAVEIIHDDVNIEKSDLCFYPSVFIGGLESAKIKVSPENVVRSVDGFTVIRKHFSYISDSGVSETSSSHYVWELIEYA